PLKQLPPAAPLRGPLGDLFQGQLLHAGRLALPPSEARSCWTYPHLPSTLRYLIASMPACTGNHTVWAACSAPRKQRPELAELKMKAKEPARTYAWAESSRVRLVRVRIQPYHRFSHPFLTLSEREPRFRLGEDARGFLGI